VALRDDERPQGGEPELPVDLRAPSGDPWQRLRVPSGWHAVSELAREAHATLPALAERIVECVAEEIPAYRARPVPREDLAGSVRRNVEMILLGLAERRDPTVEEIAVRRELGTRRALQGLPVDALLGAYHVGYRELWLALVRAVPPGDEHSATQLLTAATLVWSWVHQLTDAIAAAHAATVRSIEARAVGARQRFVELLMAGDLGGAEADRLARSLGFDPAAAFAVTVLRGATGELDAVDLQRAVDDLSGRHAVAARGPLLVTVSQAGHDRGSVADACRDVFPDASLAVGAERRGLGGARDSLTDAELTLAVIEGGTTGTFEDAWLWATLRGAATRLRPLLAPGFEVAETHPHLAEAVEAFAGGGFSVSEAARRLSLHANTVSYRLDRWTELTGWDPRRFPGLVRSVAALRLRERPTTGAGPS
jgi:hypothetical protein